MQVTIIDDMINTATLCHPDAARTAYEGPQSACLAHDQQLHISLMGQLRKITRESQNKTPMIEHMLDVASSEHMLSLAFLRHEKGCPKISDQAILAMHMLTAVMDMLIWLLV